MRLPHGKELIQFLPLSDLYTEYAEHERLQVFAEKGCVCVACGRVGTFLALGMETMGNKSSRKRNSVGRVHIDLYTDDFVLMTVDHIIPKKLCIEMGLPYGAMESLDNKQPMCDPCNSAKDCKLLTLEELRERRAQTNIKRTGPEAIWSLIPNIHATLGDPV